MSNVLLLAASLRRDSYNKKLIQVVAQQLLAHDKCKLTVLNFSDFNAPLYDGDIENSAGIPDAVKKFAQLLEQASGLIISSPEYNHSIPGILKNLIDWASRLKPTPFAKKPILLLSAAPALAGGARGLMAAQITLLTCGAFVFPRTFSLSNAHQAFDSNNHLQDPILLDNLVECVLDFVNTLH